MVTTSPRRARTHRVTLACQRWTRNYETETSSWPRCRNDWIRHSSNTRHSTTASTGSWNSWSANGRGYDTCTGQLHRSTSRGAANSGPNSSGHSMSQERSMTWPTYYSYRPVLACVMCSMLACSRNSMARRRQHQGLSLLSGMVMRVPLRPLCCVADRQEDSTSC
jgi:hypothetical protein